MNDDIFECCREGDLGGVKRLIEELGVLKNEVRGEDEYTPLYTMLQNLVVLKL